MAVRMWLLKINGHEFATRTTDCHTALNRAGSALEHNFGTSLENQWHEVSIKKANRNERMAIELKFGRNMYMQALDEVK